MISISFDNDRLILNASEGDLAPKHESQLSYWGFNYNPENKYFISPPNTASQLLTKVSNYLNRCACVFELDEKSSSLLKCSSEIKSDFIASKEKGRNIKQGILNVPETKEFLAFIEERIPRKLKEHQIKSAIHLLAAKNSANFSVPGSGKTTVVLSVFQRLREIGEIDSLFVVGPPACFGPWRMEYSQVLGAEPTYEILAGGDIDERHSRYLVNQETARDIYLTSFQTLHRDWEQVRTLFEHQGVRFFLVIDEAHYIKQLGGSWANAVLNIARYAKRRCVLTGTPFPKSYIDAFNLFDTLWPECPPIPENKKQRIQYLIKRNNLKDASDLLNDAVDPLFYRVRKSDLCLAPQVFNDPICIEMNKHEKHVYDLIIDRIRDISKSDYMRDLDVLMKLRRGRMMRLRQCVSYTGLLTTAVEGYREPLYESDPSLQDIICNYDKHEQPAKLGVLLSIIKELREKGEKVVVWSNFIKTLELILTTATNLGYGARLIYGNTPSDNANVNEELTREGIIRDFVSTKTGVDILIANPAACAESISLHKTCSHAVYYDLSYNCAQYLQSLDRIHRVGGSENKPSYYYFLQYEGTIDQDILANIQNKAQRMSQIIDQDYPIYSLDMFSEDEELDAYERLFGKQE